MKVAKLLLALGAGGLALGTAAQAPKDNMSNPKQMKVSGTDLTIPPVPQEGKKADAIRNNLKRVKLPPRWICTASWASAASCA